MRGVGIQAAEDSAWGPCPDPVSQGRSAQTQEELLYLGQGRGPPRRGQDVRVCFPIRMWESIPQRLQDTGSHPYASLHPYTFMPCFSRAGLSFGPQNHPCMF